MSDGITIEFGPVEEQAWFGMARAGPEDTKMRIRLRINGEYVPPMGAFYIDGEYNVTFTPYKFAKHSAEFLLSDDQTADYHVGRIDWEPKLASVTFQRHDSAIDICLTYERGFWGTVSERVFAEEIVRSGREYLTIARDEILPKALEDTKLHEQEAELYHEDLDELEALLDEVEDLLADFGEKHCDETD